MSKRFPLQPQYKDDKGWSHSYSQAAEASQSRSRVERNQGGDNSFSSFPSTGVDEVYLNLVEASKVTAQG